MLIPLTAFTSPYTRHARSGLAVALCVAVTSCATARPESPLSATPLVPILEEALTLIQKYQSSPMRAARLLAYVNIAILDTSRKIPPSHACAGVAYALAGYTTLDHFFPLETPGRLLAQPRQRPDWHPATCTEEKQQADAIAQATVVRALRDGANPPSKVRPHPGAALGLWVPTPPLFSANPTEPYAGEWQPLAISSASQFRHTPPPQVTSVAYQNAAAELFSMAENLSPIDKDIAEK